MNAVIRMSGMSSQPLFRIASKSVVAILRSPHGLSVTLTVPDWPWLKPGTLTTPRWIVPSSKYGWRYDSTFCADS